MDSIRDTDAILNTFARYCHEGNTACALYRDGDAVEDVERRFFGTLAHLKDNPILLTDPNSHTPIIITYSDVKRLIFVFLYAPIYGFGFLALILDAILTEQLQMIAHGYDGLSGMGD
jgi:hypothetical protein